MQVPSTTHTYEEAPPIVFFDIETTVPNRVCNRFWVLEFGAIVVCPHKLVEIESFSTLIRPGDLSAVSLRSSRLDGITREAVSSAPAFHEVADKIYATLNGRIWAGHNIQRFDCVRIKESFAEIGRQAPEPVGVIDSLGVLTEKFGRRAGNMKVHKSLAQIAQCQLLHYPQMATLADYFGLGQQKHRSLDDARMNLEVIKHCATVLLLESSQPSLLNGQWRHGSSSITTRSRLKGKLTCREETSRKSPPTSPGCQRAVPYARGGLGKMTEGMKSLLYAAQGSRPINNLLKHSRSILR